MAFTQDFEYDLQGEVDRKCLSAIETLQAQYTGGHISAESYVTGLRALNDALRGLVDEDVIVAIDAEVNALRGARSVRARLIRHEAKDLMLLAVEEAGSTMILDVSDVEASKTVPQSLDSVSRRLELSGFRAVDFDHLSDP